MPGRPSGEQAQLRSADSPFNSMGRWRQGNSGAMHSSGFLAQPGLLGLLGAGQPVSGADVAAGTREARAVQDASSLKPSASAVGNSHGHIGTARRRQG